MQPRTAPRAPRSDASPGVHAFPIYIAALALAAGLALAGPAAAQEAPECSYRSPASELEERASPPDSSSVRLADGVVKVCYSSPRTRGRDIFGGLVAYGSSWRLGANEPTTVHTTVPLSIGGVRVEPGSYSLYAVPDTTEWKLVVNTAIDRWGIPINDAVKAQDVGSVSVAPESLDESVESLRIRLESAGEEQARMTIAWATTRVAIPIEVAEAGGEEGS